MGHIPRKLKKVNGFVLSKAGLSVYEDKEDKVKLELLGKIFDTAVEEGRIIMEDGKLPTWDGAKKEEMNAHKLIMAHYLKNLEETGKLLDKRERLGYH
ncbi:hypothetical protein HN747_05205 [archaeon]|nr:hypothetical protein [archaeon]